MRLGSYEILSPLGAGGMGEVYRARHVKLRREAAIKVLPSEFASDPERLRRFEREARAASALNHPAIVTIYDIDEHEGTTYIAMELVEGDTLRRRLAERLLDTEEALRLATSDRRRSRPRPRRGHRPPRSQARERDDHRATAASRSSTSGSPSRPPAESRPAPISRR